MHTKIETVTSKKLLSILYEGKGILCNGPKPSDNYYHIHGSYGSIVPSQGLQLQVKSKRVWYDVNSISL